MIALSLLRLIANLAAAWTVSASPLPTADFVLPRQLVDCNDLSTTADPSCWGILDVGTYITTNWTATARTCNDTTDDATCCAQDELWANCFIRLAMGPSDGTKTSSTITPHCDMVGTSTCPSDFIVRVEKYQAQARYVVIAIQSIHAFFSNWDESLSSATLQALLQDQALVNELDPVKKTHFFLGDLLTALTSMLSFVGAPELGGVLSVVAKQILNAVQQAPAVAKTIWPTGTDDSKSIQLANLNDGLMQINTNLTNAITASLSLVMTDILSFSQFASSGIFTGPASLSLPNATAIFGLAFRTYVLSTTMTANKWRAVPSCDLTRADVESNVPDSGGMTQMGCTLDDNNICSDSDHIVNTWYSDSTACAYTLTSDSGTGPNGYDLMNDIVSNSWSTLEQLFDGALNCTKSGNLGKDVVPEIIGYGLDLSCMSQLSLCSCNGECPVNEIDGICPVPCCSD